MSALPSNLAFVGEDLARATSRDARRAIRRRRLVTLSVVLALLVLTVTAAVANGWLFSETPTIQAVPSLSTGAGGAETHTLLTGLGPQGRVLTAVTTAGGGVCLTLTGFDTQCVPVFTRGEDVNWVTAPAGDGTTLVWGIARDEVVAIDGVSRDGQTRAAEVANDGFYVELPAAPDHLVIHLRNGSSEAVPLVPCPPTQPACTK
jgi:hypothetical protein